jgi:hypothetical protein
MIARRENFGGTAPSHFLRQATVVKNTRRPRQRHITARRTEYAIKAQRFYLSDLFPDEEKHLTPIGRAHHESPRCSLTQRSAMCSSDHSHSRESRVLPQPDTRQTCIRQDHTALRVSGAPSPQEPKRHSSDHSRRTPRRSTRNKLRG